jgi:hypothetical protein
MSLPVYQRETEICLENLCKTTDFPHFENCVVVIKKFFSDDTGFWFWKEETCFIKRIGIIIIIIIIIIISLSRLLFSAVFY